MIEQAKKILKSTFGYDTFRSLQEEVIRHVCDKKDTLVLMPTGGGKSICFQIPALMFEGITIVVSPLISLMKDQVETLRANGVKAAYYNSSMSDKEGSEVINKVLSGEIKLLYMSPEKLLSTTEGWLGKAHISLVAIDEAHCVSMWGHDFRPEYTQLKAFREKLSHIPFIALTATADKTTRNDIINQLGLQSPKTVISSFDRPNLSLEVRSNVQKQKKIREIISLIHTHQGQSGIIYCLSRKGTEELAADLQESGIEAAYYHAGIPNAERAKVQESFVNDELQVICATIAFGMGIDKSNVRWIVHHNLPKNIESYYQEIGRAGRDSLPSQTILYYNMQDLMMLSRFAAQSGQAEILQEKLKRMQQYAEATTCRRKVLLAYFGEHLAENCNNCDVCKNPPRFFDGTEITQKALSALVRLDEKVGTNMLINVLRGSQNQELLDKGYHQIKTYGAGSNISFHDWRHYITQMLNLGAIEIAYEEAFSLKITGFGKDILYGKRKLDMAHPTYQGKKEPSKPAEKRHLTADEKLFERLRLLRKKIAKEEDVPAYVVFSDLTLTEMANQRPTTQEKMMAIQGMGRTKFGNYGKAFISEIKKFISKEIGTYELTYQLYKRGLTPEEIASEREMKPDTIYSHLNKLYEEGKSVNISRLISEEELIAVKKAHASINDFSVLKPYLIF